MHYRASFAFEMATEVSLTLMLLFMRADRLCRALSAGCSKCLIRAFETAAMEQAANNTGVQGGFASNRSCCVKSGLAQRQKTAPRLYPD
jgi:hypothetical protein